MRRATHRYIGEVCVTVNPYRDLGIYGEEVVGTYEGKAMYMREPHVFALANTAYTAMRRTGNDVVVVISGESGAGKTEASKQVMRFVAAVNSSSQRAEIERVKNQLLASNPLLEAFGNVGTNEAFAIWSGAWVTPASRAICAPPGATCPPVRGASRIPRASSHPPSWSRPSRPRRRAMTTRPASENTWTLTLTTNRWALVRFGGAAAPKPLAGTRPTLLDV